MGIFLKKFQPPRTVTRVVPSTTLPPYTPPHRRVHSTDDIVTIQSMNSSPTSPAAPEVSFFPFLAQDYVQKQPPLFFFFFLVFSNPEQFFILSLPLTSSHIFESTFHRATLKLYPTSVSSRSDSCHEFLAGMLQK